MGEEEDLKAKIAALEGRIQKQKHTTPAHYYSAPRWSPYQQPTYQSRPPPPAKHRNRTLVVNNASTGSTALKGSDDSQNGPQTTTAAGGVTTRDRGLMQWTNSAVYDQRAHEKQKAIEETAVAKKRERDARQKTRILKHVHDTQTGLGVIGQPREIVLNDLRFRIASDGSKLIRVFGEIDRSAITLGTSLSLTDGANRSIESTPKQTKVAGVLFVRSKNGNLLRSGLVKKQRYQFTLLRTSGSELITNSSRVDGKKSARLCPRFTATGIEFFLQGRDRTTSNRIHGLRAQSICACSQGNRCRFAHDLSKLAICKEFLRHGNCTAGEEACNLSHDPTPNRVPACTHFLRGSCTKPDCRYAHVHVNPSAPVCRDFAILGYCEKGAQCTDRHVTECPDYSNTGACRNSSCRLPHIDRAGNLRKAAALKANKGSDQNSSDVSSDEEDYDAIDSDDVDSDDLDEDTHMAEDSRQGANELNQQQDFISFR